ncbi:carbohydrate ABC transporter permease [Fodinicola acaciae]|uniref:carbohydrate ABC transporter permease n=1 Tax=Fodinicola acaciae TaxID=2681555 RepID=UPI001FE6C99C|nr:sugar ABC transporter permease [Fodinicola acaciae]
MVSTTAEADGRKAVRSTARSKVRRWSRRDTIVVGFMLGIPTILNLAFVWLPALTSVGLSLTSWDGIGLDQIKWVGLKNYTEIFTIYPPFWPALEHNVLWLVFFVLIPTPIGLLLAVMLDRQIRGSRFYQGAIYLPVVLSLAIVGFIWQLIYSNDQGILNEFLKGVGLNPVNWLGDSHVNLWAVLVAASWRHVGYMMILYLAGLKGVDPSLKEAAAIDGANEWQTFVRVVFPSLRPVNIVVVVITVIESLRAFDLVYIINGGFNGLELLSALVTQNIIGEASRIGYGSAIAVIMMLISTVFIVIYVTRIMKEETQ